MATKYIGNSTVRETPESGRRTRGDASTLELVRRGKYTDLESQQPGKGDESIVTGYLVEQSVLHRLRGGWGELVISLVANSVSSGTPPEPIETTIEIDMAQVERPLVLNPKLGLSDSAPDIIAAWRESPLCRRRKFQAPKATLTTDADPDNDNHWETMDEDLQKVARKILKGIESWLDFYPVVVRTSTYESRPDPADCGKIQSPPVSVPGNYEWLKTADRITQTAKRKYQRVEQWTASHKWDPDLYGGAT